MTHGGNAIAVIGMGGRFPDAPDLDVFWSNLKEGVESIRTLSDDDLQAAGISAQVYQQPNFVRSATILDDIDQFDAEFFGFSPREAEIMDPQHRLFLESSWAAMEDAGYIPGDPSAIVGVFASVSMNTYQQQVLYRNPEVVIGSGGYQLMLGNDKDFLATRVSYKLNLRGPSMVVQTACSSSLVAVEVATQSLLRNQCDMALVGGASVTFPQTAGYLFQEGMIFSPDGHCRPFDAQAGGIRAGHGAGVVVLKRMADALADGDRIRAVILGSAINNDGAGKIGYTAPSVDGQAEVIAMAQTLAGSEARSLGYVEAHGTGTRLGDPIEVAALTQVFRAETDETQFCGLGSLKSNLGHLDAAAGVASFIKTVLSLENKLIPPSLNFSEPNPEIDFEASPFFVNDTLREWPSNGGPRRAGVSSFGIGGTNAHVILEEGPAREVKSQTSGAQLFVVSAKNRDALEEATANLGTYLEKEPDLDLEDVAFTGQVGRSALPYRRTFLASTRDEALDVLVGDQSNRLLSGTAPEQAGQIAFMFSGQGSQYPGMGRGLYERFQTFREALDQCAEIIQTHLDLDIRDLILRNTEDEAAAASLQETRLTQPALFAVEYALTKLWMSWGIHPEAMIGHSIGEWVAAHFAGVFSLADALALVSERGRLMQAQPPGVMFSVSLPEQEVRGLIEEPVCIAAINSPTLCTVSGTPESMDQLAETFQARDVPFRRIHTSHAFHSEMMDPVVPVFRELVAGVDRNPPSLPFISNVTGNWITEEQACDPDYWAEQIRQPVRFLDGVRELTSSAGRSFLEVGPGSTLTTFARQCVDLASVSRVVASLPHAKDPTPADHFALEALGRVWLAGGSPDWQQLHGTGDPRRIGTPTYPFQRKRYWVDPGEGAHAEASQAGPTAELSDWFFTPSWARTSVLEAATPEDEDFSVPWLFFEQGSEFVGRMVGTLRDRGAEVVTVSAGDEFARSGKYEYTLDPSNPEDYDKLFDELKEEDRLPHRLIHWWTGPHGQEGGSSRDLSALERSQDQGFFSLVYLSQALGKLGPSQGQRLTVVTRGTVSVLDDSEVTHPENATLLGPCAVLPLEAPWIDCRLVDLLDDPAELTDSLADSLSKEAMFERPSTLVAYRKGHRWEPYYEGLHLRERPPVDSQRETSNDRVYLITGGLGSLGRAFARHLAESGPCVLALLGRSEIPSREDWEGYLKDDPDPKMAEKIRDLQQIESLGATVVPLAADISNESRMSVVFRDLTDEYGPVTGIIHAAGVPATGILQLKTKELAQSVLDPKVKGTLILNSLVGDGPLEFFVLFSSINSILPAGGGSDYAAANAFLDSFARYRRARGDAHAISLNWDTWQEVGMAVDTEVPQELQAAKDASLHSGLPTADGLEAFHRAMGAGLAQVAISRQNIPSLISLLAMAKLQASKAVLDAGAQVDGLLAGSGSAARHQRPDLPQAYVEPSTDLEKLIAKVWQELLGIEPVGARDNFFELGGHSLLAIRVLAYLQESTGMSLPLEAIFEAPTVSELSERIETLQWMAAGDAPENEDDEEEREEFVI